MSSSDNRSAANLLLLCIEHAYEIDDDKRVARYPEGLLHTWKAAQLAEVDRLLRQGISLTDEEAREVIAESISAEILIQGETINLGGVGGQGPGAGGGSGAAIGRGAVTGRGGPGGPITINVGGSSGTDVGAGGGGAGNVDPESEVLWRGPGRTPTIGQYEYLGEDGESGGDTVFGALRARGGIGAVAGSGVRSASKIISVSSLILANSVELHGPYFCLLSGGFSHYSVLNLGDDLAMIGLLVLEAGGAQEGEYGLVIHAETSQGNTVGTVRPVLRITKPGDILRINLWFRLNLKVTHFGMWAVIVNHQDRVLAKLPIAVQQGVPGKTAMLSEE
jgi:hypothetical protein